jgi:hypothetical protein
MPDNTKPCTADPKGRKCKHVKTKYGHCNVVTCANHFSECPRHGKDGIRGN